MKNPEQCLRQDSAVLRKSDTDPKPGSNGCADRSNFGFYISGPGGTFYTQDARNPNSAAQAVTFAGTGINAGSWFLCFEETDLANSSDQDYDDAVLFLESVNPTPVSKTSWGALKSRFQ